MQSLSPGEFWGLEGEFCMFSRTGCRGESSRGTDAWLDDKRRVRRITAATVPAGPDGSH
jgi:hypothetical protein